MSAAGSPHPLRRLVAAVLGLIVASGGCSVADGGSDSYQLTAFFPRAVALYPQSQVRVLGLPAGEVTDITVDGDRVRVDMAVTSEVPVPDDVKAAIVPQSLVGERYIQLTPAWLEGEPQAEDGHVIDAEHTIVPVEPDEAFAAIKEFLDSLDPDGLGRLIHNAAEDLEGNGDELNSALDNFSRLVDVFADRDEELVQILANFDQFTATLRTRESQLGTVLDTFAEATQVLAAERGSVEELVANLARLSEDGFDLLSRHATELRSDIETLTHLASSIDANLDAVGQLLDSGPMLVTGLEHAYNPTLRAMNLRNNFGPLAQELLNPVFRYLLGDPNFSFPCTEIPAVGGSECPEPSAGLPVPTGGQPASATPPATTPVDDVLGLFAAPTAGMSSTEGSSWTDTVADGASAFGDFLSDAASTLLGVGS